MLDIQFIKDNLKACQEAAVNKNRVVNWDELLASDEKRRLLIGKVETLRAERNSLSALGAKADRTRAKEVKEELKTLEEEQRIVEENFEALMLTVPNVPDKTVPIGKDSTGNVEVKKWGEPRKFDFTPLDHIELAKRHDLIDFERGAKISGSRAYFLKKDAAMLEFAVLFYALQKLSARGYTPIMAPALVKKFTLYGSGHFPWGGDDVYHLPKDEQYLSATAEIPVTAYYADEILKEEDLPKKFVAFSPCFRREAGSYGRDTKGAYRVHQFNKIEQVIIAPNDMNNSLTLHEELLKNSEELLQDLGLPYHVLLMCTGDMGEPQVKKYDIETWMPSRNGYGETMSNSVMGDFQTRRLKVRYRTSGGEIKYCHSLNNTAIASPRLLIPILENYQMKDGTIEIPKVLQSLIGKKKIG